MTDEMKAKREKLLSGVKNGYDLVDQAALEAMEAYCETYKQYLETARPSGSAPTTPSSWPRPRAMSPISGA